MAEPQVGSREGRKVDRVLVVQVGAAGMAGLGGWPEESPPALTPDERATLTALATSAPEALEEAFARLAELWALSEPTETAGAAGR